MNTGAESSASPTGSFSELDARSIDIYLGPWCRIGHALTIMFTFESLNASTISTGIALGILLIAYRWLSKRSERIPPGPPRYPVIGNALNFPMQGWARIFPEWHGKYGAYNVTHRVGLSPIPVLVLRELCVRQSHGNASLHYRRP